MIPINKQNLLDMIALHSHVTHKTIPEAIKWWQSLSSDRKRELIGFYYPKGSTISSVSNHHIHYMCVRSH